MRIIHTSDWHLGKTLEGFSRMEEQEEFIQEFIEIVDKNNIDLVIISGDIYDNSNPPAKAEKLFYKTLKKISNNGNRAVLIIAGNHDNPERLVASSPLAYEQGIMIFGTPKSSIQKGQCGNFKVIDSDEGYVEIEINKEKAVIITLPYPSEKRLNEVFIDDLDEKERKKSYSEKVGEIFNKLSEKYRKDTINIATAHLFVTGGESSDSERSIELGGSLAVDKDKLPLKAQYIALGHLHKTQIVKGTNKKAIYSGSPIQYSKSERNNSNCAFIIDVKSGEEADISKVFFRNYKPIELWKCNSIEEAIEKCEENREKNSWVYLEIKTDRVLYQEEIKKIKELKKDIIEIKPVIKGEEESNKEYENMTEKSMKEIFLEFYKKSRSVEPTEELTDLFLSVVCEEEE